MSLSDNIIFMIIYTLSSINHAIFVDSSTMINADIDEKIDNKLLMISNSIKY